MADLDVTGNLTWPVFSKTMIRSIAVTCRRARYTRYAVIRENQ